MFNECVDTFVDNLHMAAELEEEILMRKEFGAITLQVMGKVAMLIVSLVTFNSCIHAL